MKNNTFKEKNHFNDRIVYFLLVTAFFGATVGLFQALIATAFNFTNLLAYLTIMALSGGVFWWLRTLKIKVSINNKRIKYKLFPIHKKSQRIAWEEVESCKIVKTPLAAQWHGSNIRFGGESYFTLSGRNGLSIETKDGKRYFIGCKNVDHLVDTLKGSQGVA